LSAGQWIRRFADDQWNIWSGPFRSQCAIKWDLLFAAGTGALIPADRHITNSLPRSNLTTSRDISNIASYTAIGSLGALWIGGLATDNAHARETGILGVESVANAAAVWAVMNTLTRRERPLEGTGHGRFWVNNGLKSSMPSAHSMLTWAAASTIAHEYPNPLVEGLAYGAATAVSVTRVTGLRHFPSDSFVGTFVGYFIGRQIFKLHCSAGMSAACHNSHSRKRDLIPDDSSTSMTETTEGTHAPWLVRAKNFVKSTLD
jgi:membrane-associated phospholipid phosphatase